MVVTIDGPAASGKSSVSRELAKKLGWNWVSTGAFYRGLAYAAMELEIELSDVQALEKLCDNPIWEVRMGAQRTLVYFSGNDVTELIGHEDIGSFASKVSQYPTVRKALLEAQRRCSNGPMGLVAEGRDCGTIVFPSAQAKIYLTANQEDRAARRAAELGLSAEDMLKAQSERDQQDASRKAAPMQVPQDAMVVDTSNLNLDQVVAKVESYIRNLGFV